MKNLILKSIPIMGIMVCLLSNNIMVNASEEKESNEMPMIAIDSQEYGINGNIMPMKTITGNAGSCTLDYVDRSIQWAVKPKTTKKYLFIGNIRIVTAKTNDAKGSGSVSASGKGTQTGQKSISSMYAKLKKGYQYKAYFSGIASTYDNKQTFMVAQDAHITFTYR